MNTGQPVRNFSGHGSQLTAIAVQPLNQPTAELYDDMEDVQPAGDTAREGEPAGGEGEGDDAKSDGSYDPLFDEPDTDGVNGSQDRGLDLSLPGTVPNPQFNRHMPSSTIPKNAPQLLDPHTYSTYSSDVLMTASIDGQIFLWDRRVETQGKGVGRLFMSERTPPWCASVGSNSPPSAQFVLSFSGMLVSERYPSLRWTEKWNGRYLGCAEIRI